MKRGSDINAGVGFWNVVCIFRLHESGCSFVLRVGEGGCWKGIKGYV